MEEYLECIICYDEIDKDLGDFILDICDKCKYVVHISCYEKFISINSQVNNTNILANICLMCHKSNNTHNIANTNRIENQVLIENIPVQRNKICSKRLIVFGFSILLIVIIITYNILISNK